MAYPMAVEALPSQSSPVPSGRARGGREEVPARSFEDVLRELDRTDRTAPREAVSAPEPKERRGPRKEGESAAVGDEGGQTAVSATEGQKPEASAGGAVAGGSGEGRSVEDAGSDGGAHSSAAKQAAGTGIRSEGALGGHPVAAVLQTQGGLAPGAGAGSTGAAGPEVSQTTVPEAPESPVPAPSGQVAETPPAPQGEAKAAATPMALAEEPAIPLEGQRSAAEVAPNGVKARQAPTDDRTVEALLQSLAGKEGRAERNNAQRATPEGPAPEARLPRVSSLGSGNPGQGSASPEAGRPAGATVPAPGDGLSLGRLLEEAGFGVEPDRAPTVPGEGARSGSGPVAEAHANGARAAVPQGMEIAEAPLPQEGAAGSSPAETPGQAAAVSAPGEAAGSTSGGEASGAVREGGSPASMPMAQVGDVVVKRLQQLRNPGSDELRIELEPKELGALKIHLELRGDGVKAQFVVDRPVVQAMLEQAMAELRQNLAQQGYRVDELRVALQGEGQAREQAGEQSRGESDGRHHGRRIGGPIGARSEVEPVRWGSWAGAGRIDIRA